MASTGGPSPGTGERDQEVITTNDTPITERLRRSDAASDVEAPHVLSEFERLMDDGGCPSCRYVTETERSFFSWFAIESFSSADVQARLRRAIGMCPAHSRRLVEQLGEGHIMTTVMREALTGARQAIRGELDRGACPACEATARATQRARSVVLDGLLNPANARAYEQREGLCLPHLVHSAPAAQASTLALLAERLLATLQTLGTDADCNALAGVDEDAIRRSGWRRRLPPQPDGDTSVARLGAELGVETCPVCLATGLGEGRYLEWFIERAREYDATLRGDPGELCSVHLHDLELTDPAAAREAAQRKRDARIAELRQLLERLAVLPAPGGRKRRNASDDLNRARQKLVSMHYCPACHARDQIDQSRLELLLASLALSNMRERYERSHGLCVAHALQLRREPSAAPAIAHIDGRLGMLTWEVGETARKYAWACRHELDGPERDAWARALVQVDGRVFAGGPPPATKDMATR